MGKDRGGKAFDIVVGALFTAAVLCVWEGVAHAHVFGPRSELVFPTLESIFAAFVRNFTKGYAGVSLWSYIANSMRLLLLGLVLGIVLAFLFSGLAMLSRLFRSI